MFTTGFLIFMNVYLTAKPEALILTVEQVKKSEDKGFF